MSSKLLGAASGDGFMSQVWLETLLKAKWAIKCWFVGDADIDSDGGSNPDGDIYWNPDTTLHSPARPGGRAIDAERVSGIVVPAWLVTAVRPVVLGCMARVTNLRNKKESWAVVHDTGPLNKVGEITPALARTLGINPNSVSGGEDAPCVLYEFWPGVPAMVQGVTYQLQPFGA